MFTMRLPNTMPAPGSAKDRHGCIQNKGRKNQHRDPEVEESIPDTKEHECAGSESDRNTADVTHENPGGRKIMEQKPDRAHGHNSGDEQHERMISFPTQIC